MNLEDIRAAQLAAATSGRSAFAHLSEMTGASDAALIDDLGKRLGYPVFDIGTLYTLTPAFDLIPYVEALNRICGAFLDAQGNTLLVSGDPLVPALLDWADMRMGKPFRLGLALRGDLEACLRHHAEQGRAIDAVLLQSPVAQAAVQHGNDLTLASVHADESPIIRLTNSTLFDAYRAGASDIHLEASTSGLRIKYRLDGVLSTVGEVPGITVAEQVVSRIKVMAELDISERRVPQDGRLKVVVEGREVDLRISVMPSVFGEDVVLRILDKHALSEDMHGLTLETLGFRGGMLGRIRRLAREPYGMLLVTGPTGSGKTTTLYAAISEINTGQDKIITIEDPVEYQLPGVLQIPVNERKGLTFARGLRSILRHDPDKIMVGEIRDEETAQIAVQSALTGHLVLTTMHANNVFDVISRFLHMGVAARSFVSALNGILAQRLLRLVCPSCAVDVTPAEALLIDSGLDAAGCQDFTFRSGRGCAKCRGTGYKGRQAIAELLHLNDEMRELIVAGAPLGQLRKCAAANGLQPLREAALAMVGRGETTLEEINRVTFVA